MISVRMVILLLASWQIGVGSEPAQARGIAVRYMRPQTSKCFLAREPKLVRSWLTTLPGSLPERAVIEHGLTSIDSCFGINSDGSRFKTTYDFVLLRAGLVRAILVSNRNSIPEQLSGSPVAFDWKSDSRPVSEIMLSAYGVSDCLVKKDWKTVRQMILAIDPKAESMESFPASATKREVAAVDMQLDKLIVNLPVCVHAPIKISLNRAELRNLVQESALHAIGVDVLFPVAAAGRGENAHA